MAGADKKKAKVYALLAAYTYPKRRGVSTNTRTKTGTPLTPKKETPRARFFRKTRKVHLNMEILKDYEEVREFTTSTICVFQNDKTKEVVMGIRGTDLTRPEDNDLFIDGQLFYGKEENSKRYKTSRVALKSILAKFPEYKVIITAHSLGARIGIDLLDGDLGGRITEVHAFNVGTSLPHLYKSNQCFMKKKPVFCKNRRKLHIHLVNNDPVSVLSIGEKAKTHRLYTRKKASSKLFRGKNSHIKNSHSILNFV